MSQMGLMWSRARTIATLVMLGEALPLAQSTQTQCFTRNFTYSLDHLQFKGGAQQASVNTAQLCQSSCCANLSCTAWQFHVSSTDPTHHPQECWQYFDAAPLVTVAEKSDVWTGNSSLAPVSTDSGAGGGAVIQPLSSWYYYGSAGNLGETLTKELTDQSIGMLQDRARNVSLLGADKASWLKRQAEVYTAFGGNGSGPFAPVPPANRSPPNYTIVKTLTRPGYTCDLVLYETRPGFYVTGSIWTPRGLKDSGRTAPGILMVSGHTPDGFRSNNLGGSPLDNDPADDDYEVVEINLVARGFVVLAFDPIGQGERMQYADIPAGQPDPSVPWGKGARGSFLWSSTADHEYIGRQLLLNGVGLMSFWLHDEMISVDLLESLPYVDGKNLGVVGCSGGGTQSSYLGAMDKRIKAASMACYISTKEIDMLWNAGGGGDGEQTWPHGIVNGLDKPDLIEVRADKATQVLITTGDTCFPAAGGMSAIAEAGPAYQALGGSLYTFTGIWHHGWVLPTREQINTFFCDTLSIGLNDTGCANSTEIDVSANNPDFEEWNDADLKVTSTGQVNTAPECTLAGQSIALTVHNFSADLTNENQARIAQLQRTPSLFIKHVIESAPLISGYIPFVGNVSSRFLGAQFPTPHPPGCIAGRVIPGCPLAHSMLSNKVSDYPTIGLVEAHMIKTEGQCFAVVTLFFPKSVTDMMSPRSAIPAVLWYSATKTDSGNPSDAAQSFTSQGYIFVSIELCGFGTTGPRPDTGGTSSGGYAPEDLAHEIGRSIPGFHAGEINRVHNYLVGRSDCSYIALAVVEDHIEVAMMHAILAIKSADQTIMNEMIPKKLVFVGGQASLAASAKARLYDTTTYYSWIFGVLTKYDLPDALAAIVEQSGNVEVLVLGPQDEILRPLTDMQAKETYAFALSEGGKQLSIQTGPVDSAQDNLVIIQKWFNRTVI